MCSKKKKIVLWSGGDEYLPQMNLEKSFLGDSRWRLMSKMPAEFQRSITLVFANIFAFYFLQCASILSAT
jgi:hypothetical protein